MRVVRFLLDKRVLQSLLRGEAVLGFILETKMHELEVALKFGLFTTRGLPTLPVLQPSPDPQLVPFDRLLQGAVCVSVLSGGAVYASALDVLLDGYQAVSIRSESIRRKEFMVVPTPAQQIAREGAKHLCNAGDLVMF